MTRLTLSSGNKYGAVRCWSDLCGRWFASKAEARRGEELALLERAGEISNLEYQKKYVLCDDPKISITIDFSYVIIKEAKRWDDKTLQYDVEILEDAKGMMTREFRVKLAWLKEKYGIEVKLIREGK